MMDSKGNLLTDETLILEAAQTEHTNRLLPNECKEEINNYIHDINKLCETRLQSTLRNRTKDWEMSDLKEALKELKKNKSTDPLGYINELFTLEVAGEDLLLALLILINKIKTSQYLPSMLSKVNISSIYKSKERNNKREPTLQANSKFGLCYTPCILTLIYG